VALLGSLVAGSSACGFLLTQGPPPGHERMNAFRCTESNAGPILDLVEAVAGAVLTVGLASTSGQFLDFSAVAPAFGGAALVYAISGGVGLHRTSECRAAIRQLEARQAQARPAPTQAP